jgi:hypothetical protein
LSEAELASVVDRVAPVLGAAEVFAFVLETDGRVAWTNDAVRSGFGELVGANVLDVILLRLRAAFRRQLDEAVAGPGPVSSFDTVAVDAFGNQAALAVTLVRVEAGGEAAAGVVGMLRAGTTPLEVVEELTIVLAR